MELNHCYTSLAQHQELNIQLAEALRLEDCAIAAQDKETL
jgi:hypothetical protein